MKNKKKVIVLRVNYLSDKDKVIKYFYEQGFSLITTDKWVIKMYGDVKNLTNLIVNSKISELDLIKVRNRRFFEKVY